MPPTGNQTGPRRIARRHSCGGPHPIPPVLDQRFQVLAQRQTNTGCDATPTGNPFRSRRRPTPDLNAAANDGERTR
jgi:hypothetical protein